MVLLIALFGATALIAAFVEAYYWPIKHWVSRKLRGTRPPDV